MKFRVFSHDPCGIKCTTAEIQLPWVRLYIDRPRRPTAYINIETYFRDKTDRVEWAMELFHLTVNLFGVLDFTLDFGANVNLSHEEKRAITRKYHQWDDETNSFVRVAQGSEAER